MAKLAILLIKVYRYVISPWLVPACRFYPSCSQYALGAYARHGLLSGTFLAAARLLRCHPFHPGGYDPVPERALPAGARRLWRRLRPLAR